MVGEVHSKQMTSSRSQRPARRSSSDPRDDGVDTGRPKRRSVAIAQLAGERGVKDLHTVLGGESAAVTTCGGMYMGDPAAFPDGTCRVVRASKNFYGRPHYSWLKYVTESGQERIGRARVIITGVNGAARRIFVVERTERAPAERDCPLTGYGCHRLR